MVTNYPLYSFKTPPTLITCLATQMPNSDKALKPRLVQLNPQACGLRNPHYTNTSKWTAGSRPCYCSVCSAASSVIAGQPTLLRAVGCLTWEKTDPSAQKGKQENQSSCKLGKPHRSTA